MQERSRWATAGTVVAAVCGVLGGVGCLLGLSLILSSASGPESNDPHGYGAIGGVFVLFLSAPFLLVGLLVLLPPRISTWLSRVTLVLILVFLGLLLTQLL